MSISETRIFPFALYQRLFAGTKELKNRVMLSDSPLPHFQLFIAPQNMEKLQSIYDTTKNARVRLLLSAALRRPWESGYRGNQRHALSFDQEFTEVLVEEFNQTRLARALKTVGEPQTIKDLATTLDQDRDYIAEVLMEMASEGKVNMIHKQRVAHFMV